MGSITRGLANNISSSGTIAAGGINNDSLSAITTFGFDLGSMVLIKEQTASSSASIEFINGTSGVVLDTTYNNYLFSVQSVRQSSDGSGISVDFSTDGGSTYGSTKRSVFWRSSVSEDGVTGSLNGVFDGPSLDDETGAQSLTSGTGNDADESSSATFWLYEPGSTTFMKGYGGSGAETSSQSPPYIFSRFYGGLVNTTSAINAVKFVPQSASNFVTGTFKLYGFVK